jgi:hypothetical protein
MNKPRRTIINSVDEVESYVSYDGQTVKVTIREYNNTGCIKEVVLNCCPYIVEEMATVQKKVIDAHKTRYNDMRDALTEAL